MITFVKNILANKGSYWQKHKAKAEVCESSYPERKIVIVNDEIRSRFEEGAVILIDKPLHWTSFDVVRKIRNTLRIKKTGHAGTLDPLATGLLIVCTGKFTKKINEFMAQEKEYTGSITLGAVTPTYDLESLPEQQKDISEINIEKIKETIKSFTGEIQQLPPIYSAIKQQGKPMYELARRGESVEMKPRTVFIKSFDIIEYNLPVLTFKIECSTGTYIRSIANDLGAELGCGGYLSELRRTRIGNLHISEGQSVDEFLEEVNRG